MMVIQIVKLPDGEAPVEIRQAWLGLKLPCRGVLVNGVERVGFIAGQVDEHSILIVAAVLRFKVQGGGALTRKPLPTWPKAFRVNQYQALQILKQNKPEAANWWEEHGFPNSQHAEFLFRGDEAIELQLRDD